MSRPLNGWRAAACVIAGLVACSLAHGATDAPTASADPGLWWLGGVVLGAAVGAAAGLGVAWQAMRRERELQPQPQQQPQLQPPAPQPLEIDTRAWTEWLDGWYWQTDARHQLQVLRPSLNAEASVWAQAAELQARGVALPELADEAERARLIGQLQAHGRIDLGDWAWGPDAVEAGMPEGAGRLLGMPRLDAHGVCIGHHGVWRLAASAESPARAVPPSVMVPERDEVAEAAQEALRYALSHDLRAPLRVIDGFARILKEDHAAALDKLGRDHVERILAAAQRMNGMIDAVLDQAHLSQAPLQRADVDLSALARDVAGELIACRPPLADGSLPPDVRLEVAEGMCSPADAMLVRRVFENLIGNAIKYSQKVAAPHITIGAVPHTDPEVYFVRDNGAGFDMKHADKLFGLFQRLHSTREFPGSGVGLASVNNIIRRHGGRVWAEAAPGEGACFYFSLAPFKSGTTRR